MRKRKPTRREFAREVAALAVVPTIAGAQAAVGANPSEAPPRPQTPAQALLELVRLRFGRHLNEEQLRLVQERLARNLRYGDALRRPVLHNGDEPCVIFTPDVF